MIRAQRLKVSTPDHRLTIARGGIADTMINLNIAGVKGCRMANESIPTFLAIFDSDDENRAMTVGAWGNRMKSGAFVEHVCR